MFKTMREETLRGKPSQVGGKTLTHLQERNTRNKFHKTSMQE